jgi:hypothetical protein
MTDKIKNMRYKGSNAVHARAQSLCYVVHGDWRYNPGNVLHWAWFFIALLSYIAENLTKRRW